MTQLTLDNIGKDFGKLAAIETASLSFESAKLTALLGPSGCGKTTLLRIIAGLEQPTRGRILAANKDITDSRAEQRKFGMVFQSFALFPHLSVADNITYSLRIAKKKRAERNARAQELLTLVKLDGLGTRRIGELSGGQRQRVAIARALAQQPDVFLLDEPMSALDAQLRNNMQMELRLLQQRLGITTIVVTHDQREAMTMADQIVVMSQGRIEQIGTPQQIYHQPANNFVASFIGNANLLPGTVQSDHVMINEHRFDIDIEDGWKSGDRTTVFSRPETLQLSTTQPDANALQGVVTFVRDQGASREIHLDTSAGPIMAEIPGGIEQHISTGESLFAHFPRTALRLLPPSTGDQ